MEKISIKKREVKSYAESDGWRVRACSTNKWAGGGGDGMIRQAYIPKPTLRSYYK